MPAGLGRGAAPFPGLAQHSSSWGGAQRLRHPAPPSAVPATGCTASLSVQEVCENKPEPSNGEALCSPSHQLSLYLPGQLGKAWLESVTRPGGARAVGTILESGV